MKKKTVRKLEFFLHFLTSLLIILKGSDEVTKKLYFPGCILLGLGIAVLAVIVFWKQLKMKPKKARICCYYLEAPALLIISYVLHLEKKEFFPHIFLLAAFMYPVVGFISSKKFKKLKKSA